MALLEGRSIFELQDGLQLRRARVMGAYRIKLSGFTDAQLDRLKAGGCFFEIIFWKPRLFITVESQGVEVLERLLSRQAVSRISEKGAA